MTNAQVLWYVQLLECQKEMYQVIQVTYYIYYFQG